MYCWKCSTENPYAKFCFGCAFPLAANLDAVSFDRIVEPFDGAAFDDFQIRFGNNEFVIREDKLKAESNTELKIALKFVAVIFAAILIVNNSLNLYYLINLYGS